MKKIPYIIIVVLLLIILFTPRNCKGKTVIKREVKVVERVDTLVVEKPILKYKYKERVRTIHDTDTVIEKFRPSDYLYTYDTLTDRTKVKIVGWGAIRKIKIENKCKDSIIYEKETIYKTSNQLYLGGGYNVNPLTKNSLTTINLDYTFNKILIGVSAGADNKIQPYVGFRIGIKL